MKDELFEELLESVREGGAVLRGDAEPSRRFRRRPQGPARVLLRVAEEHPEAVLDVVRKAS
ncbi:MAG: hypothetical protein LC667_19565 [Thioalkalivibrio sp.]|nr:hypothetical protein [Thioalkalivibrio sp.]